MPRYEVLFRMLAIGAIISTGFGCSSFPKDWEAATAKPATPGSVNGPWEGRWESERGHGGGRLRCLLQPTATVITSAAPQASSPHASYTARFEAKYWKLLTGRYSPQLTGTFDGSTLRLSGKQDLGVLAGGTYTYGATVTPTTFEATYRSQYDQGKFTMHRP